MSNQNPKAAEQNDVHLAFVEKYRGGREFIKSRLRQYLLFINPLKRLDARANRAALRLITGMWSWITLKQGSRPRRVARIFLERVSGWPLPRQGIDPDD